MKRDPTRLSTTVSYFISFIIISDTYFTSSIFDLVSCLAAMNETGSNSTHNEYWLIHSINDIGFNYIKYIFLMFARDEYEMQCSPTLLKMNNSLFIPLLV